MKYNDPNLPEEVIAAIVEAGDRVSAPQWFIDTYYCGAFLKPMGADRDFVLRALSSGKASAPKNWVRGYGFEWEAFRAEARRAARLLGVEIGR